MSRELFFLRFRIRGRVGRYESTIRMLSHLRVPQKRHPEKLDSAIYTEASRRER